MDIYLRQLVPAFLLCALLSNSNAAEIDGYIGAELRYFFSEPLLDVQSDHSASLSAYIESHHDFSNGDQRIAFSGFSRADSEDNERSHADIRELYWWHNFDNIELYVGVRKVFWGVTESIHLVDIVNQTDNLESPDGEDKLGQPMIQFVSVQDWGTIDAFILPYFRKQEFPGEKGRLRIGLPVQETPVYQDDEEERHLDYALRWSHYVGIWDVGVSYFKGTDRNPLFFPVLDNDARFSIQPYYAQVTRLGTDIQATIDAWLFKLEALSRDELDFGRNTSIAGGAEYTFFTLAGTNADLGIIVEYQFDDRRGIREPISQNDLVVGARWALNDVDGSELLLLASQDLDHSNRFFSIELSRRLSDHWKIEAETRFFSSIEPDSPEYALRDDDYLQIEVRRYF